MKTQSQVIINHRLRVISILSKLTSNLAIMALALNLMSLPSASHEKWTVQMVKTEIEKLPLSSSPVLISEKGEAFYKGYLKLAEKFNN